MSDHAAKFDKLVLLVHGVGDPEPGETLTSFARALAAREAPLEEHHEVLWPREKPSNPDFISTFEANVRHLEAGGERFQLVEVFWGDLSRVAKGFCGIVLGLLQIVFGLRYVAYVASDQPGRASFGLKHLGLTCSRILHGPVLAVTLLLALLTAALYATQLMWDQSYKGHLCTQLTVGGVCIVGFLVSSIGWNLARSAVVKRFWFWVFTTSMFVVGLFFIKTFLIDAFVPEHVLHSSEHPGVVWYCSVMVMFLGILWFTEMLILVAMFLCWAAALWHPKVHNPAVHTAFLIPAMVVGLWSFVVPLVLLTMRLLFQLLADLPEYSSIFDETGPLLSVQLGMMLVVFSAALFVAFRYVKWRALYRLNSEKVGPPPRLIINPVLQFVLGACAIFGIGVTFSLGIMQMLDFQYTSYLEFRGGSIIREANKYAVMIVVPLGGLFVVVLPRLQAIFDIVLDVVNHFHFRETQTADRWDDEAEIDLSETTFENGKYYFSRRDAIHCRMKRILEFFRERKRNRQELVLISHSQGTMVAIKVLNDPELSWLQDRFSKITLITMGSPLTHLYQHYFRNYYPPLDDPHWQQLLANVDRWANIFRADDFVGTAIDFPKSRARLRLLNQDHSTDAQVTYSNHEVGLRGHIAYWNDREVLEIVQSIIIRQNALKLHNFRVA